MQRTSLVSDEIVDRAFQAWLDHHNACEVPERSPKQAMRAALEAVWPEVSTPMPEEWARRARLDVEARLGGQFRPADAENIEAVMAEVVRGLEIRDA